jgi:hypothetical protein
MKTSNNFTFAKKDNSVATRGENKMKAIVQSEYGSADVLKLEEIDKPVMPDNISKGNICE